MAISHRDESLRDEIAAIRSGEVPQLRQAFELWELAGERAHGLASLENGLLLCDVRISALSGADTHKGPDLTLQVRAGGARRGRNLRGAEDTWAWTMSMPVSELRAGEPIWLRVVDRDTWSDEYLGARSLTLRTFPMRWRFEHVRVECRGLPRAHFDHHFRRALGDLDRALDRLTRVIPDVHAPDFGRPRAEIGEALRRLRAASAWVTPDDPELAARVALVLAWEEEFSARLRPRLAELRAGLPAPDVAPPPLAAPGSQLALVGPDGSVDGTRVRPSDLADWPRARAFFAARVPPGTLLRVTHGGDVSWHRLE